jgi:hypothetical protein
MTDGGTSTEGPTGSRVPGSQFSASSSLFPQAWVKVLEQVDVAAAETWSLEEIGMERASAAVSGARSNLFVSSWLGLHLGTPLPLQVEDFHYSQVHLESPLFLRGRLSSSDMQTQLCTPHFLPQVGHQSLQPIIERYNSCTQVYWQLLRRC